MENLIKKMLEAWVLINTNYGCQIDSFNYVCEYALFDNLYKVSANIVYETDYYFTNFYNVEVKENGICIIELEDESDCEI